jgi:ubiquinone/menaquinone biosynthesis C-methylase UbiE
MIRRATELATGVENVRFVIADSEQLPSDDGEFTAVLRRIEPRHVRLYSSSELDPSCNGRGSPA